MWGAILMALILVVAMPVSIIMTGGFIAAVVGFLLKEDAERRGADTVWKDLNT